MLATIEPKPAKHVIRWFLRATGYGGITLPPLGIFILAERLGEERLVRHEQRHWLQYQMLGARRFYLRYIWYTIRYGYQNNPMEVEARAAEVSTA
jgi:hypothetical protein